MNILRVLAETLRCREDQAEEVMRSEASARAALSRRGLFVAAGAVAAGALLFEAPQITYGGGYVFLASGPNIVDVVLPERRWQSLDSVLDEYRSDDGSRAACKVQNRLWSGANPIETGYLRRALSAVAESEGTGLVVLS